MIHKGTILIVSSVRPSSTNSLTLVVWFYAGRNVDSNRMAGDLTIAEGSEYEIETKGKVVLAPGFKVEKGALFSVSQSDY